MAVHFHVYKNIIQSFSNLISDETRKDVTFTFTGSDVTIKAHKCILETVSPVFKSMLSGNFTETDEVKIDDIRPEVFQLLINGIYLQKINPKPQSPQTFLNEVYAELYYAAEKYDIEDIREISKKFLINDCSSANVHWMLTKAKLFNIIDLETKCMAIFKDNTYKVLSIHIQLILDDEILSNFFDLHNLEIAQEYDLYVALEVMVDIHSLQNYSKCLRKIRFLTMDTKDIILCKLLTSDEKVAIISNIEARKSKEQPEVPMPSHLSPLRRPRISLQEK